MTAQAGAGRSPDLDAGAPTPASVAPRGSLASDARHLLAVAWRISPRRVVLEVVLLLAVGLVGGASLLLLVPIVNALAEPGAATVTLPVLGGLGVGDLPLPALLAGVVALTAASAALQRASTLNSQVLEQAVTDHLRTDAYAAILGARWSFVLGRRRSDIISTVAVGSARAGYALGELLNGAVTAVVALVTAGVALLVEPALSAIAIAGTLVLGAALATSIRPAYRMGEQFTERAQAVQAVMTDSLDSLRLVRAHDAAEVWRRDLAEAFAGEREIELAYTRRTSAVSASAQVGLVASAAVLVLVAVWLEVPPPTIVVVLLLVARLARSVQNLASITQRMAHGLPAVRDIAGLTAEALAAAESPGGGGAGRTPAAGVAAPQALADPAAPHADSLPNVALVALNDVSFRYPHGDGGVTHLTFDIPTGSMTALTGPSGAGKSTTADLVLGLLEPDSGTVLIDGRPLTHTDLRAWRARVAYVPQETVLIPGSLRRNLLWSVGESSDEACWHALDRAAATFARELPQGLDTPLGDRGMRLSGGERQRIAIARALLRSPDLLVLDEATSSLDDATESAVLDLLRSLTPAVTVLVIAHRRSTIDAATHVVALADGRVVAAP